MAGQASDRQEPAVRRYEQGADRRTRAEVRSICRAAQMGVSLDARNPSIVTILHRELDRVRWSDGARELLAARAGPNTSARAPPQSS